MTKEQLEVKNWMTKFRQETPNKPCIPSLEIRRLRAKLILEEALETVEALGFSVGTGGYEMEEVQIEDSDKEPNLVAIADGLADLHVVGYCGTAIACGIDMEPLMKEVLRSNDSKLWTPYEYCHTNFTQERDFIFRYLGKDETQERTHDTQTRCYLVKNSDGKIIKSPSYSPANILPILQAQGYEGV